MGSKRQDTAARVALISGAGTGIGRAIALHLARNGFTVVAGHSRSADGAEVTVQAINDAGGNAWTRRVDISEEAEVEAFFAAARERHGRIDVVINNAGIGHMKPFRDIPMSHYDFTFGVNARGTFMMCREAARTIEDNGRIVNISTGSTVANSAEMALYVGSKMAVEGFTAPPKSINSSLTAP